MKRIVTLILVVLLVGILCACNEETSPTTSPMVEAYRKSAQNLIDQGDLDAAILALEQGFADTKDELLATMLEDVKAKKEAELKTSDKDATDEKETESLVGDAENTKTEADASTEVTETSLPIDLTQYIGSWATEDFTWTNGGYILSISEDNTAGVASFDLQYIQSAPYNRIAEAHMEIQVSAIVGNEVILYFEEDGWGNSGNVIISVSNTGISFTVANIESHASGASLWGFYNAERILLERYEDLSILPKKDITDDFTAADWYQINIFLSNFSEQNFNSLDLNDSFSLLSFAFTYSQINMKDAVSYDSASSSFTISADTMDRILLRFFGNTVPHTTANNAYGSIEFRDEKWYAPAASGEFYGYLTIVSAMYDNGDGTYDVEFDVYSVNSNEYYNSGISSSYYYMDSENAATCGTLSYFYSGTAVVRDSENSNYQLVHYDVD